MEKKEPEAFFDPADKKPRDKSEKRRLRNEEANKQKTQYRELKQVVKQADANHKQRKKTDKKHIKEVLDKARLERKTELKTIQITPQQQETINAFCEYSKPKITKKNWLIYKTKDLWIKICSKFIYMKYQLQNWNSKQRKEKMEEFNKKYHSEKHNRDMLIKQIKVETKTEYVKTLKQIDEAYPEIRRRQFSFKLKKWFFGVGKEFSRIRWINRDRLLKDFIIIIIIVAILSLIFLGIDMAVLKWI